MLAAAASHQRHVLCSAVQTTASDKALSTNVVKARMTRIDSEGVSACTPGKTMPGSVLLIHQLQLLVNPHSP